jgi:NAD(P)H-nitrite reductase large subunit
LEERVVDAITGDATSKFKEYEKDPEASVLTLKSGKVLLPAQLTILGLGVCPDTAVIKEAGTKITPSGPVKVKDHFQTSAPNVLAVDDAIKVNNPIISGERWAVPLAGLGNRQV